MLLCFFFTLKSCKHNCLCLVATYIVKHMYVTDLPIQGEFLFFVISIMLQVLSIKL